VHLLQVLDSEALEIALRSLYAGMSENLRQVKQVSTVTKIPNAEGMPEGMKRAANPTDSKIGTQLLKITEQIPLGKLPTLNRAEN